MDPLESIDYLGSTCSNKTDEEKDYIELYLTDNNSQYCEQDVDIHMFSTKNDQNQVSFLTD